MTNDTLADVVQNAMDDTRVERLVHSIRSDIADLNKALLNTPDLVAAEEAEILSALTELQFIASALKVDREARERKRGRMLKVVR